MLNQLSASRRLMFPSPVPCVRSMNEGKGLCPRMLYLQRSVLGGYWNLEMSGVGSVYKVILWFSNLTERKAAGNLTFAGIASKDLGPRVQSFSRSDSKPSPLSPLSVLEAQRSQSTVFLDGQPNPHARFSGHYHMGSQRL